MTTENGQSASRYVLLRDLPDRDTIERFFDDGMIVVGWRGTKEVLLHVGTNTELNREVGDFVAEAIRSMMHDPCREECKLKRAVKEMSDSLTADY